MSEIQDGIQNVYQIQISNYRVKYTDLKANVCLNACLHFDQILKGSYMIIEAYIFLQAVKLSYLRWHPKWPPEKSNSIISSLFVYHFFEIDTTYHMGHRINKQMLFIYFKKLRALNYLKS